MTVNTNALQTLDIPLSSLLAWNEHVRMTAQDAGIDELAATRAACV